MEGADSTALPSTLHRDDRRGWHHRSGPRRVAVRFIYDPPCQPSGFLRIFDGTALVIAFQCWLPQQAEDNTLRLRFIGHVLCERLRNCHSLLALKHTLSGENLSNAQRMAANSRGSADL
jgi:hypothetical protein